MHVGGNHDEQPIRANPAVKVAIETANVHNVLEQNQYSLHTGNPVDPIFHHKCRFETSTKLFVHAFGRVVLANTDVHTDRLRPLQVGQVQKLQSIGVVNREKVLPSFRLHKRNRHVYLQFHQGHSSIEIGRA